MLKSFEFLFFLLSIGQRPHYALIVLWHYSFVAIEGTVMKIEKVLINDCLRVSKVSWKYHIPTFYNFALIYLWDFLKK